MNYKLVTYTNVVIKVYNKKSYDLLADDKGVNYC